jgi:hypothetical protein
MMITIVKEKPPESDLIILVFADPYNLADILPESFALLLFVRFYYA